MKKIKAKNYFPYPSQESFEDALNIIAEIRAENYFWTKKIWYVEQKIKKFANDDINREFYVRLRDKLDEKICNSQKIRKLSQLPNTVHNKVRIRNYIKNGTEQN